MPPVWMRTSYIQPKLDDSAVPNCLNVIPAHAEIQEIFVTHWIPAFAGMTDECKGNPPLQM